MSNVAHAGFWSDKSAFVGGWWETSQIHWNFKPASRIGLVLWNDESDELAGLATFYKGGSPSCIGYVSLQSEANRLRFKRIEGSDCTDLDEGYFEFLHKNSTGIMLTWYPADTLAKNKPKLSLINTATYRKYNQGPPESLQGFIDKFKSAQQPIDELIASHSYEQAQVIANARASLRKNYDVKFSEADLIGVWKGQLIDQFNVYPVEIAFWPSQVYRLQRIVGVFSFDGSQCPTGFVIFNVEPEITLFSNHDYIDGTARNCIRATGNGYLELSQSKEELNIYFDSSYNNLSGARPKQDCLDELPREGCFSVGNFTRSKASPSLIDLVGNIQWGIMEPPEQHTWDYLKNDGDVPREIRTAYIELASKNEEIRARLIAEAEKEEIERRKKERESYKRKLVARENNGSSLTSKPVANDLAVSRRALKNISGPFSDINGGDYLNAIYQGDLSLVRHADRVYLAELQPLIQDTANMVKMMAPLVEWVSGGVLDQKYVHHQAKNLENASIFKRVLATYLFNFQRYFSRCLREDHVKFVVYSSAPDVVYTNYLGVEVTRVYGNSSQDAYLINREFQDVFRDIGRSQSESGGGTLVDSFYNKGKITRLHSGTKDMMAKYQCDSREIRRLEGNFLALYLKLN